jgi:hypothetical protein
LTAPCKFVQISSFRLIQMSHLLFRRSDSQREKPEHALLKLGREELHAKEVTRQTVRTTSPMLSEDISHLALGDSVMLWAFCRSAISIAAAPHLTSQLRNAKYSVPSLSSTVWDPFGRRRCLSLVQLSRQQQVRRDWVVPVCGEYQLRQVLGYLGVASSESCRLSRDIERLCLAAGFQLSLTSYLART